MQVCPSCGEENPPRFRLCGFCGAALAPALPPQEERKVVTVFFSDLKGSTDLGEALDAEALREVMSRYFDAMTAVLRRHGGTIEKFIGDAIMAVFGLPRLHEDDALRAVRAAAETRDALAALNDELEARYGVRLTNRTGVNTGEVVAGDPTTGQRLVTGDTVNVAARLEQAAPAHEILIGPLTHQLVRDRVTVEPVEPLELKGKSERFPAYRLVAVHGPERTAVGRGRDLPLVGRERELAMLVELIANAAGDRRCWMATIVGEPGVGKSRLVTELVSRLGDDAVVVRGRCLSYGEGITFWPLAEIARDAASVGPEDPPEVAIEKLRALTEEDAVDRVAAAVGLSSQEFPVPELIWGARRLLESLAAERPLVAVVDDIHWAEPTFLSLLEHLGDHATAPIVLLCTARHDLLEANPGWGDGERRIRLELAELDDGSMAAHLDNLLDGARLPEKTARRVVEAADGNPLFVEQLVSTLIERGLIRRQRGEWVADPGVSGYDIPPSIQALVAARLDLLERPDRAVIEPAAVIGVQFASEAVHALAPDPVRGEVDARLAGMVRKHLVRTNPGDPEGEDHRFQHVLIRETAYSAMLKRARAELHERFVDWADAVNRERARAGEYEEISAYHLEQAYRYLTELGRLDQHATGLGRRASARLRSSGQRAFARGDMPAAATLLRRASETIGRAERDRVDILPELAEALMETGAFPEALSAADEAATIADAEGWLAAREHAVLVRLLVERYAGAGAGWGDRARDAAQRSMAVFRAAGDVGGEVRAWRILAWVHGQAGEYDSAAEAAEQVVEFSRRSGDTRQQARGSISYAMAALYGPTPVPEAIQRCLDIVASVESDRRTQSLVLSRLAELHARDGRFDLGRAAYRRAKQQLTALGSPLHAASVALNSWRVELLAGDLRAAEQELEDSQDALATLGEHYYLSTIIAARARIRLLAGDLVEAERLAARAAEIASDDDVITHTLWRLVRSRVRAARGEVDEALDDAREAWQLIAATQDVLLQVEALSDFAEVLLAARRDDEAARRAEEAVAIASAKGDRVVLTSLERFRQRMAQEGASARRVAAQPRPEH